MHRPLVVVAPFRIPGVKKPEHVECLVAATPFGFPQPGASIVVKTTCSYAAEGDGPRRTARYVTARPWNLGVGRKGSKADDDHALPDDLVPYKPVTDVLLVGHADVVPTPSGGALETGGAFTMSDVSVSFRTQTDRPGRIPLRAPWLEIVGAEHPRLGAGETPDPQHPDQVITIFDEDFDFGIYQAAQPSMRAEVIPAPITFTLSGVAAPGGAGRLEVELPDRTPRALIDWSRAGRQIQEIFLLPDTITVDLDASVVDVTWRGNIELDEGMVDIDRLLIGFATHQAWQSGFGVILREMPRGVFSKAWRRHDVAEGKVPPPLSLEEYELARHETMDHPVAPEPTLSLAEHAHIMTELMDLPPSPGGIEALAPKEDGALTRTRASVLSKYGLDEFQWGQEERSLAERLTTAPRPGTIHEQWERELDAALAARARPEEDAIIARDYAELSVALENEPAYEVLSRAKLTLGGWMRLEKKWRRAMHDDLAVRAEIEEHARALRERAEVAAEAPPQ